MRVQLLIGAIVAATLALSIPVTTADTGSISGTVTAKGLRSSADVVISLQAPGVTLTAPQKPVDLDQKGMVFAPHVLAVVRGTTVRFVNSDPVPHNVFSPEGKYNLGTWPQGEVRDYKFDKPGIYTQLCRVHPEMTASVVVLETPHFALTDQTGRFEIKEVPPGKYTLVAWSERLKETKQPVTIESGKNVTVDVTLSR